MSATNERSDKLTAVAAPREEPPRPAFKPTGAARGPVWTRGVVLILAVALVAAAALRVALTAQAPAFLVGNDSADYFSAGYSVATGGSLVLPLKRAPLYSLFLAGCIAGLGPSLERAVAVQHALGLVTVVLTYLLGALAFSRPVGLVAAVLVALNGSLLQMEQLVISEALFTPLLLGALVVCSLASQTARRGWYLATGVCLGLAALTRPAAPALLPVVLLPLLLDSRTIRWRLERAALALAGMLLLLGPWAFYQEVVRGSTAFTGGLGDSLYSRVRRYDAGFVLRDDGTPPADPEQAR
ncbi:MAG: glycosyltransferase family 39 protein, partial [Chloroflexi bacterium]|nr:glycosyltransferase family 39 protein [Chloroflexota bacterium]